MSKDIAKYCNILNACFKMSIVDDISIFSVFNIEQTRRIIPGLLDFWATCFIKLWDTLDYYYSPEVIPHKRH